MVQAHRREICTTSAFEENVLSEAERVVLAQTGSLPFAPNSVKATLTDRVATSLCIGETETQRRSCEIIRDRCVMYSRNKFQALTLTSI